MEKLTYVDNEEPGITRKKKGKSFQYFDVEGNKIDDKNTLKRIKALVIPPAWTAVWICPKPKGHIQATGRDSRGRKQYRYHAEWNQLRNLRKFEKLQQLALSLPGIRERLDADLRKHGLPKEKVLATIVKIMDLTAVRVGNEEYARDNKSYGLTTLLHKHVTSEKNEIKFKFKGKSGVMHNIEIHNPRLAKIVQACEEIPGQHLFQYEKEDGEYENIYSQDVNDYLREITGIDVTAKDLRTWAATSMAVETITQSLEIGGAEVKFTEVVKTVSTHLRNRPATCRKYYIHPAIEGFCDLSTLKPVIEWCEKQPSDETGFFKQTEIYTLRILELSNK